MKLPTLPLVATLFAVLSHLSAASAPSRTEPTWQEIVAAKVAALRFGVVQIIVHDGKVIQVECTERTRLTSTP